LTRLLRYLLLLLAVLALLLLAMPFTAPGNRLLFAMVDRFTPLEIDYRGGAIAGRLQLARLSFDSGGVALEIADLEADLAPACLWRSVICLRELSVGKIDLAVAAADGGEAEPVADAGMIEIPVLVEVENLSVGAVSVSWPGGSWRQGRMRAGLTLGGSSVTVGEALVDGGRLELHDTGEPKEPPGAGIVLPPIILPLELVVDPLTLNNPSWDAYGVQQAHRSISLRARWRESRLQIENLEASTADWGELSLRGELLFSDDWPMRASVKGSLERPSLHPFLHERELTLDIDGSLSGFQVNAASPGRPAVLLSGEVDLLDPQMPFQANLDTEWSGTLSLADLVELPETLREVELVSPLRLDTRGTLAEQFVSLSGGASGLGYEVLTISLQARQRDAALTVQELVVADVEGGNRLRATGEVSFAEELAWSLSVDSPGFDFPEVNEYATGRLQGRLDVDGRVGKSDWQVAVAEVDLHGTVNQLPALIKGHAGVGSGQAERLLQVAPSDLRAEINGADLVILAPDKTRGGAVAQLTIDDLGRWQPGSAGELRMQINIPPDWRLLRLEGDLQGVVWGGIVVQNGTIGGQYRLEADHAFNLDLDLVGGSAAGMALDSLQLLFAGTATRQELTLTSRGDLDGSLSLSGKTVGRDWSGRLAPTALQTPQGTWSLAEALDLHWSAAASQLSVEGHCWLQPGLRLCPSDLVLGEAGSAGLEAVGDLRFLAALLPQDMSAKGELQLQAEAEWAPGSDLRLDGRAEVSNLQLVRHYGEGESSTVAWDKVDATIRQGGDGLALDLAVIRDRVAVADAEISLPSSRDEPLGGVVRINQMQLGSLAPFLPDLERIEGDVTGSLAISGTVNQPRADGTIRLSGGSVALIGNSTEVRELTMAVDVAGDRADLQGRAMFGGGELQLSGQFLLAPEARLVLQVTGGKHTIFYPPSAQLQVSEDLALEVTAGLFDIQGEVVVHEGRLEHEELPEGSVDISSDVVEVDYAGNVITEKTAFATSMDVLLRIRERFKVVGSNIDATVGGDLQLLQTSGRPIQVFGNLNVAGGEVRAYEQHLKIKRGVVAFSGTPDNPELDVRAQRDFTRENISVGVAVRGTLEQPTIEFYSDPVMSQAETLSWLVRGRGLDVGAGSDGTAMALSLGAGLVNRSAIVSELNQIPGVSNIQFGAEGSENDTAATVSGYIGEKLYLSYGIGLYEPINVITARFYIKARLWLEVVSRLENSVDLYYSWDID